MYHLMNNLPVIGTLGVVALLAGPLARLPIDLGFTELDQGSLIVEVLFDAGNGGELIFERGALFAAAQGLGIAERAVEIATAYAQERQQFGKPIGSYQVVQHRLADMFMAMEQGRSMAMLATMSVNEPDPTERARNIAMAKVGVGQAGRYVSQSAIQMHGGIGMTEEYAVGHYFRRCMVIERLFGDPAYYLAKLAAEVV